MSLIQQHRQQLGTTSLCRALEVPRASFYRQQHPKAVTDLVVTRRRPEHALSEAERQTVLATLHEPRFVDLAPPQVYAQLLEEGRYLCSVRTMYRLLADHDEVRERRAVAAHPVYTKPELLATAPNEVCAASLIICICLRIRVPAALLPPSNLSTSASISVTNVLRSSYSCIKMILHFTGQMCDEFTAYVARRQSETRLYVECSRHIQVGDGSVASNWRVGVTAVLGQQRGQLAG